MSHKNKKSLTKQIKDTLTEKFIEGRNKHEDKILQLTNKYIYLFTTLKTYIKHCNYFAKYCKVITMQNIRAVQRVCR